MNAPASAQDIADFRASITPDLFEPDRYIDWNSINIELAKYTTAIRWLQSALASGGIDPETLAAGLQAEPRIYDIAGWLLFLPQAAIGFSDGRELPEPMRPLAAAKIPEIASLLIELGLPRLLPPGADVERLVRTVLTGIDAGKRRYRVGATIKDRLKSVLDQALEQARQSHGIGVEQVAESQWPPALRGRLDSILAVDSRQCIAIVTVFQTASGGRQQNELTSVYPGLQREIAELGLNLVLVADGRGVREARDTAIRALFSGVASCMTFKQASGGRLLEEILRLIRTEPPTQESRALKSVIHAAISAGRTIRASEVPTDSKRASVSLALYASENSHLDLVLDPAAESLSWGKPALVTQALALRSAFSPAAALNFFASVWGESPGVAPQTAGVLLWAVIDVRETHGILPKRLVVAASSITPSEELARQLAGMTLAQTPGSRLAVLLSASRPDDETAIQLRRLQSSLTANILVIDSSILLRIAQSKDLPGTLLSQQLLEQSDLIKASPFVLNSVTPERMFYGRESEEADMVSTLGSNSIALLGGRRIGKTSMMRHAEARLKGAGFQTLFCDCQTVRDWDSFADMAARLWNVAIPRPFRPAHLLDLVNRLKQPSMGKMVVFLDEIDQLLDWDRQHSDDQVPEAFFRACRTISQESVAQFVFSGERTIAGRLWDPQSPHWNFCQRLMLRQLDRHAAAQLLIKPLRAMQVTVAEEAAFAATAWTRTSGHPQLLQTLGDELVQLLNGRAAADRATLAVQDLITVADSWSYADHFITTYWGQATPLERALTLLIAKGCKTLEGCRSYLAEKAIRRTDDELRAALRMIELYGMTDPCDTGYSIRLEWFDSAIGYYGGIENQIEQCLEKLK